MLHRPAAELPVRTLVLRGERALPLEDLSLPGPSLLDENKGIVEVERRLPMYFKREKK